MHDAQQLCFCIAQSLVLLDAAAGAGDEAEAAAVETLDGYCRQIAPMMPADDVTVSVWVGGELAVVQLSLDPLFGVMAERIEAVMPWQVPWRGREGSGGGGRHEADPLATAMAVADMNRGPSVEDWPC